MTTFYMYPVFREKLIRIKILVQTVLNISDPISFLIAYTYKYFMKEVLRENNFIVIFSLILTIV